MEKKLEYRPLEIGSKWRRRRTYSHSLLREHQNHNQLLNNHRLEDTGTHQKRYPTSKDKVEATWDNHNKIKSHNCWVGDSQTGEHIPWKSTHWSEGSEPHVRLPNMGVRQQEEEFLENHTLKASRIWLQDFNRTGWNRDSTLGGHKHSSVCIGTQGKEQWPHRRMNQTYLLVLEGLLQRRGVAVSHSEDKDTGSRSSGKHSLAWALPESTISPIKEPW